MQAKATRRDYENFLLSAYFGKKYSSDAMGACIERAYLDFSRTLRGIASFDQRREFHGEAIGHIKSAVGKLRGTVINDQTQFDKWHEETCFSLKFIYDHGGFLQFEIGQAQKWVNMTLKYIYTFGDDRIPDFSRVYPFCHVPIDNRIIDRLKCFEPPELQLPWSQSASYNQYLNYQKWIRGTFTIPPLDLELFAWTDEGSKLEQYLRDPQAAAPSAG